MSLVGPQSGGDPMGEAKLVRRSLSTLGPELAGHGFSVCPTTVARRLRAEGYSPRIKVERLTTWHSRKRDDVVQEALGKMWYSWRCCLEKSKDPVGLIGPLIHWSILHVRYDRKERRSGAELRPSSWDEVAATVRAGSGELDGSR